MTALNLFEDRIVYWIQETMRSSFLNPIAIAVTSLGNAGIFWILLTLALLICKKTRKIGLCCAIALIADVLAVNVVLKPLVARARPYAVLETIVPLGHLSRDFSFPSGHSAASFACAWALYKTAPRKYGVCALVLAALIALSRLYVGVHYPTDVIAGALTGMAAGFLGARLGGKICRKKA